MKKHHLLGWTAAALGAVIVSGCGTSAKHAGTAPEPTATAPASSASAKRAPITEQEVNAAQQAWCDSLINIAKTYAAKGDYKSVAAAVLSNQYNYDNGTVLFNPTLTFGEQNFRMDKEGAAAYFIGGNPNYPNDKGFALKPWVSCRYTNAGVLIDGDFAATMGNVYLLDNKKNETVVDKFFAFKRGEDGKLRIIVHKSSLPFNPKK